MTAPPRKIFKSTVNFISLKLAVVWSTTGMAQAGRASRRGSLMANDFRIIA